MLTRIAGYMVRSGAPALLLVLPVAIALIYGTGVATSNVAPGQSSAPLKIGASGLPIPRFVSLKADRVNVRRGPGKNHAISWVFAQQGLPVEIVNEYSNWRQVRDSEGAEGWVFHSLLSGRRTVLVSPWSKSADLPLRAEPSHGASVVAKVEPGAQGRIDRCDGKWCRIAFDGVVGWLPQETVWGAYPGEQVDG